MSNSQRAKLAVLEQYGYSDDYSRGAEADETWNEFFGQLEDYKKVQGHLVVPKRSPDYLKLSEWIARQRKMERLGRLSDSRKQRLLEIGFIFRRNKPYSKKKRFTEQQEKKWNEMYDQLCKYKNQHGDCMVNYNDEKHQELSNWVSSQRVAFGKGSMDESRKQRLDEIEFTWRVKKT
jgi:hypothetical protein